MMTMSFFVLIFGGIGFLAGLQMTASALIRAFRTGDEREWKYVGSMIMPMTLMVGAFWLALHLGGAL